ncbi:MAG: hypothetical protein WCP29_18915 [Acidobacteriota bacterium]
MTEAEVVQIVRKHLEGLFPMACPTCGRSIATIRDYMACLHPTLPTEATAADGASGDAAPLAPAGNLKFAICACGTTLPLSYDGLPLTQMLRLMNWARVETKARGLSVAALLEYMRDEIGRQVTSEQAGDTA